MKEDKLTELAFKALRGGNPYIKIAVKFFIDTVPHFLFADTILDQSQIDQEYIKTAKRDIQTGYKDRKAGYYDKWYRYLRADEGRAYDEGVKAALKDPACKEEMHIIECVV